MEKNFTLGNGRDEFTAAAPACTCGTSSQIPVWTLW